MNGFRELLAVFRIALEWANEWRRKRKAEKYQREMASLEEDPADWLGQHFNGMPIDNAGNADEANPLEHDQKP